MSTQKSILDRYYLMRPGISLRRASVELGIHFSRLFRIKNGAIMKLDEYEKIKSIVEGKEVVKTPYLIHLATKCIEKLPHQKVMELSELLERKLQNNQLIMSGF